MSYFLTGNRITEFEDNFDTQSRSWDYLLRSSKNKCKSSVIVLARSVPPEIKSQKSLCLTLEAHSISLLLKFKQISLENHVPRSELVTDSPSTPTGQVTCLC
jgi:hypothetical protein